jgi:hypothetical protein
MTKANKKNRDNIVDTTCGKMWKNYQSSLNGKNLEKE